MQISFNKNSTIQNWLELTKISDVMSSPAPVVQEFENVSAVHEKFIQEGVSHIAVVNQDRQLTGVVSQKYLYKTRSPRKIQPGQSVQFDTNMIVDGEGVYDKETLDGYILGEIMNRTPSTIEPNQSLSDALLLMNQRNVGCLVIVEPGKRVVGMLHAQNVIQALGLIMNQSLSSNEGSNRRKFPRAETQLTTKVRQRGDTKASWELVTLKNLSLGGSYFLSGARFAKDMYLEMQIQIPQIPGGPVSFLGQVKRIEEKSFDKWKIYGIGVEFVNADPKKLRDFESAVKEFLKRS